MFGVFDINRLDKELVERNLVDSRTKAQELIEKKFVICNDKIIEKPSYKVSSDDIIKIKENDCFKYVSRGGLKLEKAILNFKLDLKNKNIMDIGSSTGGFTDCALQKGANKVIAIDVGTDLLHEKLRKNPKVELHEKVNIKNLDNRLFENIDFITIDVSFISAITVINKIKDTGIKVDIMCLIKPQFECGKDIANKYKGVILNKKIHKEIIETFIKNINKLGFYIKNLDFSPIRGGDGNIEYITLITNKEYNNSIIDVDCVIKNAFKKR